MDISSLNKEHQKLFRQFKKCIDERSLQSMQKALYNLLHQDAGFIAHYDIHGFRHTYNGKSFLHFVQHFVKPPFYLFFNTPYEDLLRIMVKYVQEHAERIYYEFENKAMNEKMVLLRRLATELNCEVIPKDSVMPASVESNGQLGLF